MPTICRTSSFPEMLDDVINRNVADAQSDKNHAVMMLRGKYESTALAQSTGWDGGAPEVERNLEGAFPGLTLAIKLRGTTLAAIGERFARISFLTLAALSLVLAGGIALTYRNVTKEMALARLKSDFVSNVSHELRTPLSLIRLYAETLEMGRLTSPEKYQEYYRIIRKESERLTALINNILDFSRIEAGRKEYDFRETDMSELVHNTLDSYRYQLEQSGFQFEEKIDEVPPMRVDREAMARSLLNLVNNALKYSQDRKVHRREPLSRQRFGKTGSGGPGHWHSAPGAAEDFREVLSRGRPAGAQHERQRPGAFAGAPYRAGSRRRSFGGQRAGPGQQIHHRVAGEAGAVQRRNSISLKNHVGTAALGCPVERSSTERK